MKFREQKAMEFKDYAFLLQCPICHGSLSMSESSSLKCNNNHTFDIAKQGYINLLNRPSDDQYTLDLFTARSALINSGMYYNVHQALAKMMQEIEQPIVLDAGCGEGSHLEQLFKLKPFKKGIGIDISKDGIVTAAKQYKEHLWMVGDLAKLPLRDHAIDVILNFLSPANYAEFNRVLKNDGIIIKVFPGADYLKELRTASEQKSYSNEDIISLFEKHFDVVNQQTVHCSFDLNDSQCAQLLKMTPLGWNLSEEYATKFIESTNSITVHLDILVGQRRKS